jgi:hypothetical protein
MQVQGVSDRAARQPALEGAGMSAFKRLFALSGLTAIVGALAFAIPATASVKAICLLDAEVKATTTKASQTPNPGPPARKYVQLFGGAGTFTLSSINHTCIDIGSTKGVPLPVHFGTVNASGTFKQSTVLPNGQTINTPCGWGKILGKITGISAPGTTKLNALLGKKFAIELGPPYGAPGTGAFFWHTAGPANKPFPLDILKNLPVPKVNPDDGGNPFAKPGNPSGPKPYRYAGQILLTPSQSKDPVADLFKRLDPAVLLDKCAKAFHITGVVIVHEA